MQSHSPEQASMPKNITISYQDKITSASGELIVDLGEEIHNLEELARIKKTIQSTFDQRITVRKIDDFYYEIFCQEDSGCYMYSCRPPSDFTIKNLADMFKRELGIILLPKPGSNSASPEENKTIAASPNNAVARELHPSGTGLQSPSFMLSSFNNFNSSSRAQVKDEKPQASITREELGSVVDNYDENKSWFRKHHYLFCGLVSARTTTMEELWELYNKKSFAKENDVSLNEIDQIFKARDQRHPLWRDTKLGPSTFSFFHTRPPFYEEQDNAKLSHTDQAIKTLTRYFWKPY